MAEIAGGRRSRRRTAKAGRQGDKRAAKQRERPRPAPRRRQAARIPRAAARHAGRQRARRQRLDARDQVRRLSRADRGRRAARSKVFTRNGLDWTDKFPGDRRGRRARSPPSPDRRRDRRLSRTATPISRRCRTRSRTAGEGADACFAFDLLELDGEDLTELPNIERKERLRGAARRRRRAPSSSPST